MSPRCYLHHTATTEIYTRSYTLSLPAALPISPRVPSTFPPTSYSSPFVHPSSVTNFPSHHSPISIRTPIECHQHSSPPHTPLHLCTHRVSSIFHPTTHTSPFAHPSSAINFPAHHIHLSICAPIECHQLSSPPHTLLHLHTYRVPSTFQPTTHTSPFAHP